jgi:ribosome-binding factor A
MNRRLLRLNDTLRREISEMIFRQLKDPRLGSMVTVTGVETTPDLRQARVHVSVLGSLEERKAALSGLRSASRFMRREIGDRLDLRYSPELIFMYDDSIERGARVLALLDEVSDVGQAPSAQGAASDVGQAPPPAQGAEKGPPA